MRRAALTAMAITLVASGCAALTRVAGGAQTRTVLVDFAHDQFTSFFAHDFPDKVDVTPGSTVVFRQTWTGEPHTVTGGKIIDKIMRTGSLWFPFFKAFDGLRAAGLDLPNPNDPSTLGPETVADVLAKVDNAKPSVLRTQFLTSYDALV